MKSILKLFAIVLLTTFYGCLQTAKKSESVDSSDSLSLNRSFKSDLKLLSKGQEMIVLSNNMEKAMVAISPAWQGRVMTSTLSGIEGESLGWINHELISSGKTQEHINAFGGEDRFWLGPEGGQFSIYFKPGVAFTFDNWYVPKELDTEPFEVTEKKDDEVRFSKQMKLLNYSNFEFNVLVERTVRLLEPEYVAEILKYSLNEIDFVAYESINTITNTGTESWTDTTGKLSIWILGMFQPSPSTTVIIPIKEGPVSELGPKVNDTYFGKIPETRLKMEENVLFFLADGKMRGKIGISPERAKPFIGSYNEEKNILTIVKYSFNENNTEYVNSMWEIQERPFAGDVVNSYNDGPLEDGSQLGPFYELESSSPAAGLDPGSGLTHVHTTIHLTGDKAKLNSICQNILGVTLAEIYAAF